MRQLTYALAAITLLSVAATLLWQPPTPTGAAISGLGTQLVIRPQPMPDTITLQEHSSGLLTISDYFTDIEGDPVFYRHSSMPTNVTLTYTYTAVDAAFTNDSTTIALCSFNSTACQGSPSVPILNTANATMNTSIDEIPGTSGRGILVESGVNKFANPGFETAIDWTGAPTGSQRIASPDPVEGNNAMNFTNIGGAAVDPLEITRTVTVAPGAYTLSAYAKTG